MRKIIVIIFALYGFTLFGQEKTIRKPEYVFITNNEIITQEKLDEYDKEGLIKAMNVGVTEDERNKFAEMFGDKIGEREFIITIDLLTEEEKTERQNQPTSNNKKTSKEENRNNELKLNINDTANEFTVQMINGKKIYLTSIEEDDLQTLREWRNISDFRKHFRECQTWRLTYVMRPILLFPFFLSTLRRHDRE